MSSFPSLSSDKLIEILSNFGVCFIRHGNGSHAVFERKANGQAYTTVIQMNAKEIPIGTLREILHQLVIPAKEFKKACSMKARQLKKSRQSFETITSPSIIDN
jgi:predicted RNA binding protein YcfA (HicA-like mRNA interferase family)